MYVHIPCFSSYVSPAMESIDISYLIQAVADVEREIMKALEKQYMETLMPLRDGIPKMA